MVGRAVLAAQLAVDAALDQARRQRRAQQQMIEAKSGIARPAVTLVVPEREHRFGGIKGADRVAPALRDQRREGGAALRLDQRVLVP